LIRELWTDPEGFGEHPCQQNVSLQQGDRSMDLDLGTFLTTLYVTVDDLYQSHIGPRMPVRGGPAAQMSDSEVLCLGVAAQWRSGVPWHSERGVLRYVHKHLRSLFTTLLSQRAFNRRRVVESGSLAPTPTPLVRIPTQTREIGAIFLGEVDLSVSLGHPMELDHPDVVQARDRVFKACKNAGVPVGCLGFPHNLAQRLEMGFEFVGIQPPLLDQAR
jgi:hypothetical protein